MAMQNHEQGQGRDVVDVSNFRNWAIDLRHKLFSSTIRKKELVDLPVELRHVNTFNDDDNYLEVPDVKWNNFPGSLKDIALALSNETEEKHHSSQEWENVQVNVKLYGKTVELEVDGRPSIFSRRAAFSFGSEFISSDQRWISERMTQDKLPYVTLGQLDDIKSMFDQADQTRELRIVPFHQS